MDNNKKFDDTNSGVLFKNENKEKMKDTKDTSNWPEYQGKINTDGKEYFLSAWVKKSSKTGKMFMSLAVKPAEEQSTKKEPVEFDGNDDDELPF